MTQVDMKDLVGSDYKVKTRKPAADSSVNVKIADLTNKQLSSAIAEQKERIAEFAAGTSAFQKAAPQSWKRMAAKRCQLLECLEDQQASRD